MSAAETLVPASDDSFLVRLGDAVTPEVTARVRAVTLELLRRAPAWLRNCHPGYVTVLVEFDGRVVDAEAVRGELTRILEGAEGETPFRESRRIDIPVCYDAEFGPDLADVAAHHGLSVEELIRRHSAPDYDVHFIGFCPGFAYLSGLDPVLATPRLSTARHRVPTGSVAIGGGQTGVYPLPTPGGWRLIGRTPIVLFDPALDPPALLSIGDVVRFRPITRQAFDRWSGRTDPASTGGS